MTAVVNSLTNFKKLVSFKDWFDDRRYAKRTDSREIAKRVLRVFDAHNISVAKIPVLFPEFGFKISDFNTLDSTVDSLTPEFLHTLSSHFFISLEWLEAGEGPIQEVFEYGYDFQAIYDLIINFHTPENTHLIAYFIAEKNTKFVPASDISTTETIAVVIEIIHEEDGGAGLKYSRYLPLYIGFWHYYKTRMMLKAVSLLLFQDPKFITQKGLFDKNLNEETFQNKFASQQVASSRGVWHPDDYIFCDGQSAQEKDPQDARRMHEYLKGISLYDDILIIRPSVFLK